MFGKAKTTRVFIKNRVTKVPLELRKAIALLVIVGGFSTVIFDLFAFLMQIGKEAISAGNVVLGLICIALYYSQDVVNASISLLLDEARNYQREACEMHVNSRTAEILTKVRDKVFISENQSMPSSRILSSVRKYISNVWDLKFSAPRDIINVVSTIILFCGFIVITTIEIQNIGLFFAVISIITVATVFFTYKRGVYWQRHRKNRKELREEEDAVRNDILNIEPQDEHHSKYMIDNYISSMKRAFLFDKKDWRDVSKLKFVESFVNGVATLFIIGIKVFEVGIVNVNLETVLSIVALQTIYSTIVKKIHRLMGVYEDYRDRIKDIQLYVPDVSLIFETLEEEEKVEVSEQSEFIVPQFEVEYKSGEKSYKLINQTEFQLDLGDCVLLTGPTGCGKSTFMKMLTGKIKLGNIFKSRFFSVMHYSDTKLGSHDVLSEVVFGEDYDEEKLLSILKGLHLYDEIVLKNSDVIEYLKNTKAENYSTGQKQRLLIARMLYNLTDEVQIVAFDEATNALNDAIAKQVISFVREYCREKLLVLASHQVDICEYFATKHFEFVANEGTYILTRTK